jgi:hypothetical protein
MYLPYFKTFLQKNRKNGNFDTHCYFMPKMITTLFFKKIAMFSRKLIQIAKNFFIALVPDNFQAFLFACINAPLWCANDTFSSTYVCNKSIAKRNKTATADSP